MMVSRLYHREYVIPAGIIVSARCSQPLRHDDADRELSCICVGVTATAALAIGSTNSKAASTEME